MLSIELTTVSGRSIEISFLTDISGNSINPTSGNFSPLADPAPLAVPRRAALIFFTSLPFLGIPHGYLRQLDQPGLRQPLSTSRSRPASRPKNSRPYFLHVFTLPKSRRELSFPFRSAVYMYLHNRFLQVGNINFPSRLGLSGHLLPQ
ncbi:hypothetical protein DEO72_LG5g1251 [Vigna unguiculata]|uniref:Uncharacterized protein n=1 Tax=Vigna unguiculata TaxID=3917 RepID=A0A4D6LVU9_VIGUN|nr:hypothetical protein DEO72_LG5g1251 [Vigna unguiculata]